MPKVGSKGYADVQKTLEVHPFGPTLAKTTVFYMNKHFILATEYR